MGFCSSSRSWARDAFLDLASSTTILSSLRLTRYLPRTLPAVAVVLHILAVLDLAASVGVGLYRSYKDLSRSPDVRPQLARRARLAPAFAALAVLGFVLAGYSSVQYAALSFRVWAHQRPHQLPR